MHAIPLPYPSGKRSCFFLGKRRVGVADVLFMTGTDAKAGNTMKGKKHVCSVSESSVVVFRVL
jgi:hypothetical protein